MKRLADTRCFNHFERQSVARCPACTHHYCRECVTEHEGRLLCASCIAGPEEHAARKRILAGLRAAAQLAVAVVILWAAFSFAGSAMLRIPSAFHEAPAFDW